MGSTKEKRFVVYTHRRHTSERVATRATTCGGRGGHSRRPPSFLISRLNDSLEKKSQRRRRRRRRDMGWKKKKSLPSSSSSSFVVLLFDHHLPPPPPSTPSSGKRKIPFRLCCCCSRWRFVTRDTKEGEGEGRAPSSSWCVSPVSNPPGDPEPGRDRQSPLFILNIFLFYIPSRAQDSSDTIFGDYRRPM